MVGSVASRPQTTHQSSTLRHGSNGDDVTQLQQKLHDLGYNVRVDGKFGAETEGAVRQFQQDHQCRVDGIAGPETFAALQSGQSSIEGSSSRQTRRAASQTVGSQDAAPRAPTENQRAERPQGSQRAGDLQRTDSARTARAANASSVVQPVPAGPADERLAAIQSRVMDSARTELDAHVHEQGGNNRGPRVDQYARNAGMNVGGEWCGYFATHNYTQAARAEGFDFSGRHRMHSMEKARSYFMYSNYTDNSRGEQTRNANLRTQHQADGSARRFMTFEGGHGDRYARSNNLPHETYSDPHQLPVRAGDTILFHAPHGHIGQVESYDAASGRLTTIEGNTGNGVVARRTYDLNDPAVRARIEGFGRPALGDFHSTSPR